MKQDIKMELLSTIPSAPKSFTVKIDQTLNMLKEDHSNRGDNKKNNGYRIVRVVAVACALLLLCSIFTFTLKPALAADLPVINEIVYNLAPVVSPDIELEEKIKIIIDTTLNDFFNNSTENIGQLFSFGNDWVLDDNTLLAAYYLSYLGATSELLNNGEKPSVANINIISIEASLKAYRLSADINFDLMLDGQKVKTDSVHFEIEEKISGLVITGMSMKSADFQSYKSLIMDYKNANNDRPLNKEIASYNAFLIGHALVDNKKNNGEELNKPLTQNEEIESIAAELMYQFWLPRKTGVLSDITTLMERNGDTELFYLALDLQARMADTGYLPKYVVVEKGQGKVLDISKDGEFILAKAHVNTKIDGGIGETIELMLKPSNGSYIIVGFNTNDAGLYRRLKVYANDLIAQGISREEAFKSAYLDRLNEIEGVSKIFNENLEKGLSEDEARQNAFNEWYSKSDD